MAALGAETSFDKFKKAGIKPFLDGQRAYRAPRAGGTGRHGRGQAVVGEADGVGPVSYTHLPGCRRPPQGPGRPSPRRQRRYRPRGRR